MFLLCGLGERVQHIGQRQRCGGNTNSSKVRHTKSKKLAPAVPVFLLLCVGEGVQHVGQRREGQVQPINVMLAEGGHAALGVACDVALDGLQLP